MMPHAATPRERHHLQTGKESERRSGDVRTIIAGSGQSRPGRTSLVRRELRFAARIPGDPACQGHWTANADEVLAQPTASPTLDVAFSDVGMPGTNGATPAQGSAVSIPTCRSSRRRGTATCVPTGPRGFDPLPGPYSAARPSAALRRAVSAGRRVTDPGRRRSEQEGPSSRRDGTTSWLRALPDDARLGSGKGCHAPLLLRRGRRRATDARRGRHLPPVRGRRRTGGADAASGSELAGDAEGPRSPVHGRGAQS